jgi:PAS domain-containing protein
MQPTLPQIILQYLGIITASITVIITVFGAGSIPAVRAWVIKVWGIVCYPFSASSRKLKKLSEDHKVLSEKIDFIVDQLKPNSGSSLRDSINRLEVNQLVYDGKISHYLDSQKAIMFETSAEGLYTWVSKAYEELTNRSASELRNWGWTLSIAEEDVAIVRSEWYLAIEQKRVFEKTYKVKTGDGETVECYCRAIPTICNNSVIAWVGSLQPVRK